MVIGRIAREWICSVQFILYLLYDMREFPFKTQLIGFHMSLPTAFDALMG